MKDAIRISVKMEFEIIDHLLNVEGGRYKL